jgi:hypothetical protein
MVLPTLLAFSEANGPPTGHTAVDLKPSAYVAQTWNTIFKIYTLSLNFKL